MNIVSIIVLAIAAQSALAAGPEYEYREIGVSKQWEQCEATREQAASWARTALTNEARERCAALGSGWRLDTVVHGGYVITPECKNAPGKHFGKIDNATARCKILKKAPPKADKPEAGKGGKASDARADKDTAKQPADSDTAKNKSEKPTKKTEADKPTKKAEGDKARRDEGKKSESKKSGGNAIDDAFTKFEKETGKNTSGKGDGIDAGFAKMEAERAEKAKRETEASKKPVATETKREKESPVKKLTAGTLFKDCDECPEMVVLPPEAGNIAMGRTEVTQAQWRAVMGTNPSWFKGCDDCPVEQVSWNDAKSYLSKLNARTGKQYRLPSEAEWEYACRAGGTHTYCGSENIDSVAWYHGNSYYGNSRSKTHAVAGKQANAWGLYDMSGNVAEWVEDCWSSNYIGVSTDRSARTSGDCGQRVLRGGAWSDVPPDTRAAYRGRRNASIRESDYGFRPARMLP